MASAQAVSALPGVTRIALPTPFNIGAVNVYLLEDEPLTLIDTGPHYPRALTALERGLAERGRALADLELILLTHQHADHVGLAHVLQEASGAEIAALPRVAEHVRAYERSVAAEDAYQVAVMERYGLAPAAIRANAQVSRGYWRYGRSARVERTLAPGERIELAGRSLSVLWRPGHSPGDTVFALEDCGAALVGDHLLAKVSANPLIHRPLSGSQRAEDRDSPLTLYLESLRRTRECGFAAVGPGHGEPIVDVTAVIDSILEHHERRMLQILELIRAGRGRAQELISAIWGELAPSETFLALSEVLGHVDLLIAEGLVEEVDAADRVRFEPAA